MTQADTETKDTSTKILEAADDLFAQMGFDAVSMRDIAEGAGVNKALVFYHHNSKEELFEKVLERYYKAHRDALAEAADVPAGDTRERFHRVLDRYLDFIASNHRYPRLIQNVVSGHSRHMHFIQKSMSPLLDWTRQMLGEVAPEVGPLAARHFFVTFSAAVINYFTYTPAVEPVWGNDPFEAEAIEERRDHLHWLVDACFDQLKRQQEIDGATRDD